MNMTMKTLMIATIALSTSLCASDDATTNKTEKKVVQPEKKSELLHLADGCAGKCPKEMIRRNTEEAKRKRAEREAQESEETSAGDTEAEA